MQKKRRLGAVGQPIRGFVQEYRKLVRLHHPDLAENDRDTLAKKLADMTDRYCDELRERSEGGERADRSDLQAFKRELKVLPAWFARHLQQRNPG